MHGVCEGLQMVQKKYMGWREFPGSPVVRTRCFHCRGLGSIPGWGTKIPQAAQHGQKTPKTWDGEKEGMEGRRDKANVTES